MLVSSRIMQIIVFAGFLIHPVVFEVFDVLGCKFCTMTIVLRYSVLKRIRFSKIKIKSIFKRSKISAKHFTLLFL
jgi:hypothetical protein